LFGKGLPPYPRVKALVKVKSITRWVVRIGKRKVQIGLFLVMELVLINESYSNVLEGEVMQLGYELR